ncbi:hypothetical protein [Sandarakinorhabdus sp.]|uniref:hypothetical protein n=1 Tax=Sandarakinorhabdus sp. TaxID=1916663 RepID=UPI003F71524F
MAFVVENLRLRELAIVAEQNKPAFEYFVQFLVKQGYQSLHAFVSDQDSAKAGAVILRFLRAPLPMGVQLYDGIARPYAQDKAKWLLLGWIFRDAPEQRLRPMISSMPGNSSLEKQAVLLNEVRASVGKIFPEPSRWEWTAVSEVIIDRLEGSRRAIKGTLFEAIVRRSLSAIFDDGGVNLTIGNAEIKLGGETYDVSVVGKKGRILIPVKTRETMGGGHALLFTRDIHKSIAVAHEAGFDCLPVIIAESWAGDLTALACKDYVYINKNPNQVLEVEPLLVEELKQRLPAFQEIM